MAVATVAPPRDSAIADWYDGADLIDAYAVRRPPAMPADATAIATAMLSNPPPYFRTLIRLRDAIMARFGVKTTVALRQGASGPRIDFFPVLSATPDEVILGEDDRHLDFRLSVRLTADDMVIATSAVRCHNLLGRAYLAAIKPFHILIVRSMLARLGN